MFTTRYGQEGNSTCLKSYKIHPVLEGKYMYRDMSLDGHTLSLVSF